MVQKHSRKKSLGLLNPSLGAAPPFDPSQLHPKLWLDASDAATVIHTGADVTTWIDKSSAHIHFDDSGDTPPITGSLMLGGKNTIRFPADSAVATALTSPINWTQPFTMYAIARCVQTLLEQAAIFTFGKFLMDFNPATREQEVANIIFSGSDTFPFFYYQTFLVVLTTPPGDIPWSTYMFQTLSPSSNIWAQINSLNGVPTGGSALTIPVSTAGTGVTVGTTDAELDFAEIIVFQPPISDFNIGRMNNYFNNKWSLGTPEAFQILTTPTPHITQMVGNDNTATTEATLSIPNNTKGTLSLWFEMFLTDANFITNFDNPDVPTTGGIIAAIQDNNFVFGLANGSFTDIFIFFPDLPFVFTNLTSVNHLLISWDMNSSGDQLFHIYLNDVLLAGTTQVIGSPFTCAYADGPWQVGPISGALGEVFLDTTHYLDLDVEANRRKFIDGQGRPVFLGNNGSVPFGTMPEIFLASNYPNFGTNSGSAGNFTVTGTLTEPTTDNYGIPISLTPSNPKYITWGTTFNGTSTYFSLEDSTIPNNSKGVMSIWFKRRVINTQEPILAILSPDDVGTMILAIDSSNNPVVIFTDGESPAGSMFSFETSGTPLSSTDKWNSLQLAWDLNHPVGERVATMMVNDASTLIEIGIDEGPAFALKLLGSTIYLGGGDALGSFMSADIADLYFITNQYINVDNNNGVFQSVNPFFNGGSNYYVSAINLGIHGQTLRDNIFGGAIPEIFLKDSGSLLGLNHGTAGDFTPHGTILCPVTSPSFNRPYV